MSAFFGWIILIALVIFVPPAMMTYLVPGSRGFKDDLGLWLRTTPVVAAAILLLVVGQWVSVTLIRGQ